MSEEAVTRDGQTSHRPGREAPASPPRKRYPGMSGELQTGPLMIGLP